VFLGRRLFFKLQKNYWKVVVKEKTFKNLKRIKGSSKKYGNKESLTKSSVCGWD